MCGAEKNKQGVRQCSTSRLITVGKLKERYYAAAADEYIRRLGAYCKFELIELPECRLPDDPNGTQIAAGLAREAEQIEAKLPRGAWFCVLTPEGTELSSEGLAERLQAESSTAAARRAS